MQLRDLFEDVEMDVAASAEAQQVLEAVVAQCERPDFRGKAVHRIRTGDAALDQKVSSLAVIFREGKVGSGLFANDLNFHRDEISIMVGPTVNAETILRTIKSAVGASTFRHEYQHFLDTIRSNGYAAKYKMTAKSQNGQKITKDDRTEYVNDPLEFNAFFHEVAEPLLAILRTAKTEGVEAAQEVGKIEPDFKKYLSMQHYFSSLDRWDIIELWKKPQYQRYLKRLYVLHQAATAIQGISAPYDATRAERIFKWLEATVKKVGRIGR